jgi:ribonuclease P protein component
MILSQKPSRRALGFPRWRRLIDSEDFHHVFARPTRFFSANFLILVRANTFCRARLGLAIAKRSCPRASDRNRLKRIVRESFRTHSDHLPPVDVVVLATKRTVHQENGVLFEDIACSWRKIRRHSWDA